jgi:probable rRNA maturation factor
VTLIEVDVVKAVRAPVPPAFIRRLLRDAARVPEVAARIPARGATVAVRITGDAELRDLNRSFAAEDHATDVLSFEGSKGHVGDIAISWPAVVRQAADYGHPAETELAVLAVHGLLHLLGWDHVDRHERREMWRLTVAGLAASGITPSTRRL